MIREGIYGSQNMMMNMLVFRMVKQEQELFKYSHFADLIRIDPKYPVIMCDYVEVEFLLAEAAERNIYGVPADAADAL